MAGREGLGELLILDDTTLDKAYAKKMKLVTYHWIGKHREVVQGIARIPPARHLLGRLRLY